MNDKGNAIGSAQEPGRVIESSAWEPEERVTLPSGLAVIFRRPTLTYFELRSKSWPEGLLDRLRFAVLAKERLRLRADEKEFVNREWIALFQQMIVEPKAQVNVGPPIQGPKVVSTEDTEFLVRYLSDGMPMDRGGGENIHRVQ